MDEGWPLPYSTNPIARSFAASPLSRGIVRSMQLMSDEATALTRELRESTASQLQAVLDHVKDVILTVDGKSIQTREEVVAAISQRHVDETVEVVVNRDGTETKVAVKLGSRPGY